MEALYTYGTVRKIGTPFVGGNADHILLIDHRNEVRSSFAYGTTLCGRVGKTLNSHDLTWAEVVFQLLDRRGICGTCKRVLRGRA